MGDMKEGESMSELSNARKEKFAQCMAMGLSQRKAYREAYESSRDWKDNTVDSRASELYRLPEIRDRVQELKAQAASEAVMTIIERKEWLTNLIVNSSDSTKNKLHAVDLLNKMDGAYIEKVEMSGEVNNPFAGLSTEELKRIASGG